MAEAVVSFVVERLGDLLIDQAKFLHGVGGQVRRIRDELKWMQDFLRDADAKQIKEERIRTWVSNVRNLAYDAGDVLESYILRVESKRRGDIKSILKRYVCILNECKTVHKVGSEIQEIQTRISDLSTRLQTYGIRSLSEQTEGSSSTNERQSQLRRTYSHVDEVDFVGLEGDVEKLVAHLVNDGDGHTYYRVVSICGMGGLGKTTLAKRIYNHPNVKRHFDALSWVCISQQWNGKDILQQILIKLYPEQREDIVKWRNEELIKKLFQAQQTKKCLLVLDDIWSRDAWDFLRPAFPIPNMGSKVLLTSRNMDVATHVDPEGFLFEPRILTENESWELFQKKAFSERGRSDVEGVKEMESLGSEMVKYCGGLPLAVVVLGGLLKTKRTLREWQIVYRNIKSYIRIGEGMGQQHGGVSEILVLSYNDLPYQLKSCFVYLGQFLEDSEIEAERLYQLWMAESMVLSEDKRESETMMDVAERYLGELAHRCMVQVQFEEIASGFRKFKSCVLHDLMRELCLVKAKEEEFFQALDSRHENHGTSIKSTYSSTSITRRLVFYSDERENNSKNVFHNMETCQHLRSLLFINPPRFYEVLVCWSHLNKFKLLRVLDIANLFPRSSFAVLDDYKLSKAIGNLIHLRYLSVGGWGTFTMLPSSTANLKQLQTLKLSGNLFILYPCMGNFLRKMGQLQHLRLPNRHEKSSTKLRLDGLTNLETLQNLDPNWCDIEDLFKLTNLRKLTVGGSFKHDQLERIIQYIIKHDHLRHFSLGIKDYDFSSERGHIALRKLFGCSRLHYLWIMGSIRNKLPREDQNDDFTFSTSLTTLSLIGSKLEEDPMPALGYLRNLRDLSLIDVYMGKEMVCTAMGFPQLKHLKLLMLSNLEKWMVDEGSMPNLLHLEITSCKKLKTLPDGLKFVTTLRELEISHMPEAFNNRVRVVNGEEGEDFTKIRHVPSISIRSSLAGN